MSLLAQDETVAVCTIEKANIAINRMVLEGRLHELVCVVVDEAHMVTDPERGLPLEVREPTDRVTFPSAARRGCHLLR